MNIILGLAHGTCLNRKHPRPGLANEALAKQIERFLQNFGSKDTIVITEVPITIALNTLGLYPDYTLRAPRSLKKEVLETRDFFVDAFSWLLSDPRFVDAHNHHIPIDYYIAVQRVKHVRALRLLNKMIPRRATLLSDASVPCDPASSPAHTRALLRTFFHELAMFPFDFR